MTNTTAAGGSQDKPISPKPQVCLAQPAPIEHSINKFAAARMTRKRHKRTRHRARPEKIAYQWLDSVSVLR